MADMRRGDDLITAIVAGCPLPWTMSVMENGPEGGESRDAFMEAQFTATVNLIERDHVVLYGVWGGARNHLRDEAITAVVFPEGAKVLAVYHDSAEN